MVRKFGLFFSPAFRHIDIFFNSAHLLCCHPLYCFIFPGGPLMKNGLSHLPPPPPPFASPLVMMPQKSLTMPVSQAQSRPTASCYTLALDTCQTNTCNPLSSHVLYMVRRLTHFSMIVVQMCSRAGHATIF